MGRYADPQMVIDKRFEKVRGELDKLYKNVDNNLQLIAKRKQARKQAQAKKYGSYGDIYNKSVKDSRASSRKFARTRPDMAKDAKKQFSDQIASRFDEGYDNIQAFVRGEYISKEGEQPIKNPTESQINAFVQSQIDAANDLGESLVAFEALSNEHAKGIKAGDGSNGKNAGSVVVGSEFSNIFNAMTGDTEGQDEIQWSKMKLSGSLTGGTTIYFDGQSEGEEGFNIADPDTEVIDLSKMKTNYFNGKEESYFQKIKKKSEVADDMRTPIKTLQDNKAVNLFEMYNTVDENGNPIKMKVLNKKKTQDYFITGKGAAVTIDAMIEKHGGITAAVQSYFGADVAANKVWDKPGTKEYDQAMLKLRTRLYEDLDPLISDGDKDMLAPNKETTSRQFTKDTSSKVVRGFYEEVHGEVNRLLPTLPNDKEAMNEFNLYIQNRPYSQGGTTYTIDHMEPVTPGSSDMILVMKNGNKIKPEEGYFKLNDKQARRKLEQGLMKGNFQGTTDRKHVDGYYNSKEFGGEVEENYNGAEKESVRITSTKTKGGISYEEYMQKVEGSEKPLNSNTIDWPWETDGLGGGSQAASLDNVTPLNQQVDNSVQAQLGTTTTSPQGVNLVSQQGGMNSYADDNITVFDVNNVDQLSGDPAEVPGLNFMIGIENTVGCIDAAGNAVPCSGYGEDEAAVKKTIDKINKENLGKGEYNGKLALNNSKMWGDDWDALPEEFRTGMLQFNFNTGWDPRVLTMIANGDIDTKDRGSYLFNKQATEDKWNEVKGNIDYNKLDQSKLRGEMQDLYKNTYEENGSEAWKYTTKEPTKPTANASQADKDKYKNKKADYDKYQKEAAPFIKKQKAAYSKIKAMPVSTQLEIDARNNAIEAYYEEARKDGFNPKNGRILPKKYSSYEKRMELLNKRYTK